MFSSNPYIRMCACMLSRFNHVQLFMTLWPASLLCPWDSPGKKTGVGCHALFQGIFPTQGSNLCLLAYCTGRWVLYHYLGRPFIYVWRFYNFQSTFISINLIMWFSQQVCKYYPYFNKWETDEFRKVSNFTKVTELVHGRAVTWMQEDYSSRTFWTEMLNNEKWK